MPGGVLGTLGTLQKGRAQKAVEKVAYCRSNLLDSGHCILHERNLDLPYMLSV